MDLTLRGESSQSSQWFEPDKIIFYSDFELVWRFNFLESDIAFFITIYHFIKNVYNIKV